MTNISFEIANLTFFLIFEIEKSNFLVPSLKTRRWFLMPVWWINLPKFWKQFSRNIRIWCGENKLDILNAIWTNVGTYLTLSLKVFCEKSLEPFNLPWYTFLKCPWNYLNCFFPFAWDSSEHQLICLNLQKFYILMGRESNLRVMTWSPKTVVFCPPPIPLH